MTVYDANNKLIDYFKSHDAFRIWDDYKELLIVTNEPEIIHAALLASLNHLVDLKLLAKSRDSQNENDVYVLNRPLITQTQFCTLEFATILRIITALQEWHKLSGALLHADPFNLSQDNLLVIIGLAEREIKRMKEEEV